LAPSPHVTSLLPKGRGTTSISPLFDKLEEDGMWLLMLYTFVTIFLVFYIACAAALTQLALGFNN